MIAEWGDRKVWTYLAARWAAAANQGSATARVLRQRVSGVCGSPMDLGEGGRITLATRLRLLAAMRTQPGGSRAGFWWPLTVRGAVARAAFCRRMARAARRVKR